MLTHLQIKHFKAWRDTGSMRLAPLTVIFGANSSGKSSLGHLLLTLKQTALLTDRRRALHLGDGHHTLIDMGTFKDCVYGHNLKRGLEFTLRWKLPHALTVKNALDRNQTFRGDELELTARLLADAAEQPQTQGFDYRLINKEETALGIEHKRDGKQGILGSSQFGLVRAQGRKWPVEPPEKFYRFADRTLSRYQNADFLAEFALETERLLQNIYYLGPLRSHPRRVYQWSGDTPPDVGAQGEYAIPALLAARRGGRRLNRGRRMKIHPFDTFIAAWLKDLGVIESFSVKSVAKGRKEYEVLIRTHPGMPEVKLTDVGFGVSQILPALVQAFYAPPNAVVWMEQPEIHLHPSVQANLADAFISAVQAYENSAPRNVQLIIESHSEHFLNRLQRRVAEEKISPDEVAIYFVNRGPQGAVLEALRLNELGEIENWPEDFFGDEMADVAARTLAAMERKQAKGGQ